MRSKRLLKLILVVSIASILAMVVPFLSGCLGRPAVAPPEAPPEVAPVTQVLAAIKLEVASSTWRAGEEPYDIYNAIKEKLEGVGFEVASEAYDATLRVDYEESKGGEYIGGGLGTDITCNMGLYDTEDNPLFEKEISTSTSFAVRGRTLYQDAIKNFEGEVYFKYLGEIIATRFGVGDEVPVLVSALQDEDERTREGAVEALGEIGDRRAMEALTEALEDESSLVQHAAREALDKIEAGVPAPPSAEPVIGEGERTVVAPRLQSTITLDGGVSGNEWDDAGQLSLNFVCEEDESPMTYSGSIRLKHDGTYLWICIQVQDDDENEFPDMSDYAAILFDANRDGEIGNGDDSAIIHHGLGPSDKRPDEKEMWRSDTEFGGNNDVIGESGWTEGWYTYEMGKPLNSGDVNGYDIAVSPGDMVLSTSCFWDGGEVMEWSADAGSFYIELEP